MIPPTGVPVWEPGVMHRKVRVLPTHAKQRISHPMQPNPG